MPRTKLFSEQLRQAIEASEVSRYAMSKQTGIPQSQLSRFVHRKAGLAIESIDQLCELLGLKLVTVKKPATKAKRKGN